MGPSENSSPPLSLEELGLFNLLQRIHAGQDEIDPLLRYSLSKQGLLIEDTPPRLSRSGLLEMQRLQTRTQRES
jgi:hypothetical protein